MLGLNLFAAADASAAAAVRAGSSWWWHEQYVPANCVCVLCMATSRLPCCVLLVLGLHVIIQTQVRITPAQLLLECH